MIFINNLSNTFDQVSLQFTISQFYKVFQNLNITIAASILKSRIVINIFDNTRIEIVFKNVVDNSRQIRFVFIILSTINTFLYNRVKHIDDVKIDVYTVCVIDFKFVKL